MYPKNGQNPAWDLWDWRNLINPSKLLDFYFKHLKRTRTRKCMITPLQQSLPDITERSDFIFNFLYFFPIS